MVAVFLKLFNMSVTASWIALAVILLRLLLKKAPKYITCIMWALVGLRLVFPFSIESITSLVPSAETVPNDIVYAETPMIHSGISSVNSAVNPIISTSFAPTPEIGVNPMQIVTGIATLVWIIGMALMLVYTAVSYLRIRLRVREAIVFKDDVMLCDRVSTPFILGVIKPRIYLSSDTSPSDMEYIIAHERAHLKRRDHLWKPLGFLLLTVYWFNPVLWIAYVLLCRDIELACDEKVISSMGAEVKKPYSEALINCSASRRMISACPIAFGEVGVKGRIKAVLNYKKPAFWIIILALVSCIVLALCFLTDPKNEEEITGSADFAVVSQESSSELEGVWAEITKTDFDAEAPTMTVVWHNDSEYELTFGQEFYIYRNENGEYTDMRITENYIFTLIGYLLLPGGTREITYNLWNIDIAEPGKYRYTTNFLIGGSNSVPDEIEKYDLIIDFELNHGADTITAVTYTPVSLTYSSPTDSQVLPAEIAPPYKLINDIYLHKVTSEEESVELGFVIPTVISESNFDVLFEDAGDTSLKGEITVKDVRDQNKKANILWNDDRGEFYLLLEQTDGTLYLAYGFADKISIGDENKEYSVSGNGYINWMYELSTAPASVFLDELVCRVTTDGETYTEIRGTVAKMIFEELSTVRHISSLTDQLETPENDKFIRINFHVDVPPYSDGTSPDMHQYVASYIIYESDLMGHVSVYDEAWMLEAPEGTYDKIKEIISREEETQIEETTPEETTDFISETELPVIEPVVTEPIFDKKPTLENVLEHSIKRLESKGWTDIMVFDGEPDTTMYWGGLSIGQYELAPNEKLITVMGKGTYQISSKTCVYRVLIRIVENVETGEAREVEILYPYPNMMYPNAIEDFLKQYSKTDKLLPANDRDLAYALTSDTHGYDVYEYYFDIPLYDEVYACSKSPERFIPMLYLNTEDETFSFPYSMLSSYLAVGHYEWTDTSLILRTDDGLNTYVFNREGESEFVEGGETLTFDAGASTPLPKYKYSEDAAEALPPVADGTLFSCVRKPK